MSEQETMAALWSTINAAAWVYRAEEEFSNWRVQDSIHGQA